MTASGEDVPGKERSFGVIIARTASTTENPMDALDLAMEMRAKGRKVGVFLVADGVYNAKAGARMARLLGELLSKGVRVYASPEHLKAAGFERDKLVPGIEIADGTYRALVNFVMEEYEKVIIC